MTPIMSHGRLSSFRKKLGVFLLSSFLLLFVTIWNAHSKFIGSFRSGGTIFRLDSPAWEKSSVKNSQRVGRLSDRNTGNSLGVETSDDEWRSDFPWENSRSDSKFFRGRKENSNAASSATRTNKPVERNRLYCMVPFLWTPEALSAYHAIHSTWGKRCHILKFFIDPIIGDDKVGYYNMTEAAGVMAASEANLTLPNDVVVLHDMQRPWHTCSAEENRKNQKRIGNCRNIWEKIWRAWVYVVYGSGGSGVVGEEKGVTDAYKAEWFVKVDADTFLFPENVRRYVEYKNWSYNDHHYFGHVLNHRISDRGVPIVAGAAVFFSRATLLAAADAFRNMPMEQGDEEEDGTCRDAYTGTEEVVTAVCLKEHANVTADPALDADGREQVSLFELDDILTYNRTDHGEWWYWEGKKRFPCHDDGDCVSHLPFAFHYYKDPKFFLDFEKEFYGSVMKREEDKTLVKIKNGRLASRHWRDSTQQYLERVRAAMKEAAAAEEEAGQELIQENQVSSMSEGNNRLYCMVPFIWTPMYLPSYHAIRRTWGKRCDILKFMIDPIIGDEKTGFQDLRKDGTEVELPDDVVVILDMQRPWHTCSATGEENCRNIWEKVWRSWVWVDSHDGADSAEWFVKVDADTFLFPENLKRYVVHRHWSSNEHHYFGHILNHRIDDYEPMIAGAAVFFSRSTLKEVAAIYRTFSRLRDRWIPGKCMDCKSEIEEVITGEDGTLNPRVLHFCIMSTRFIAIIVLCNFIS